jgi:hypothetical protein
MEEDLAIREIERMWSKLERKINAMYPLSKLSKKNYNKFEKILEKIEKTMEGC